MGVIGSWKRPSSLSLAAVLAANLVLPVSHFWLAAGAGRRAGPAPPAPSTGRAPDSAARVAGIGTAMRERLPERYPVSVARPRPVCLAWGPFEELSGARTLADRLGLERASFEVFETRVPVRPRFLVRVRIAGSGETTDRALARLESLHVDSYVLERGPNASALSVGVFSALERAESQRRRMLALGFRAEVAPLAHPRQVYHLLARVPAGSEPSVPAMGACGDIAPLERFL